MTEVDKRKRNDALISFRIDFTEEQIMARRICHDSIITILTGKPGTAKTTIAASVALELIMRRPKPTSEDSRRHNKYDKIIISRPAIPVGKSLGYLPGDMMDKLNPYITPVLDVMYKLYPKEKVDELMKGEKIEVIPIQFMRGRTFENSIIILDEGQNADFEDFKVISSRLGRDSKLIVTSDVRQIDLKKKSYSASKIFDLLLGLEGISMVELTENFRHPLALSIMDRIIEYEDDLFPF